MRPRQQHQKKAGHRGDRPAGAQYRGVGNRQLAAARQDAARQVKRQIAQMSQFFIEIVAEDVEEKHVEKDVGGACVEKLVGDELQNGGALRREQPGIPRRRQAGGDDFAIRTALDREMIKRIT